MTKSSFYLCMVTLTIFYFFFIRMKKDVDNCDCFVYKIRFDGVNFPPKSPVLLKTTKKWEPSTEKMYVRDGVLKGDVNMPLLLEGGGHYRCDFKTTYK